MSDDFPTRLVFIRWLENQDPDCMVGIARDPCFCPLATFLVSLGHVGVLVNPVSGWSVNKGKTQEPLPEWAYQFATEIDHEPAGEHITAANALVITRRPQIA